MPTPAIHVSPAGNDTDGLTWATAKRTVTGGIAAAAEHGGEVWVAQATYFERIQLPAFVYLYGGFYTGGSTSGLLDRTGGRVLNNLILDNVSFDPTSGAAGWGGGIQCIIPQNTSNLTLIANNTFVGNRATGMFGTEQGGAMAVTLLSSNLLFANNVVASNSCVQPPTPTPMACPTPGRSAIP